MAIFPQMGGMFPQEGLGGAIQAAAPLLLAMGSGLQSGRGAMSQMPTGLALMMAQQEKADKEAKQQAALDAMAGLGMPGAITSGSPEISTRGIVEPEHGGFTGAGTNPHFSTSPSASRMDRIYASAEKAFQLPEGYLARTAQIESGGNPAADNPNSSASGLFQFTSGTAKQYGVDPSDPLSSTVGAAKLARDNAQVLRQGLGREPTAGELYLAHQQGAGGALALLSNPNAKASDIVGEKAVTLNGGDANMTAMDFANRWLTKFGGQQDPTADPFIQKATALLSNPDLPEAAREGLKLRIQARMQAIQAQGLTPYQAATLGQQDAQNAGGPSMDDRYKVVGGMLVDLLAPGGPQPVVRGQDEPMSTIGKLAADLSAGRITQDQYQTALAQMAPSGMSLEVGPDGSIRMMQGATEKVGRPLTEGQAKDNFYLTSMQHAAPALEKYESALSGFAGAANSVAGLVPFGRFAQTEDYQQGQVAAREWGAAVLRKESGAALTNSDMEWLESRFVPVPGDKPGTIEMKRQARAAAEAGMKSGMSKEQIESVVDALSAAKGAPDMPGDEVKGAFAQPKSKEEYTSLPSGSVFQAPDGSIRVKP